MRVCLDTNVLIAAFATRGLCADVLRTVLAEHELVVGDVMLTEMRRTLASKFKLPTARIDEIEAVLTTVPIVPKPQAPSELVLRDVADRWILATAVSGVADVLVTGDDDLLIVASQSPVPILTPRAFWELLRSGT